MNGDIVDKIIDRYLKIVQLVGEPNEGYKYDAINHFQQNWNIDDPQFAKMFKKSFAKTGNLLYQNSWGFISKAVDRFPEETREMFRKLFSEENDLKDKIKTFQQDSDNILVLLKEDLKVEKFNAQQDERTISVYLGFRHPDRYILYKSSFFKEFCSEFDLDPKSASKESYTTLQDYLPKFKEIINLREDFVSAYRKFYPKPEWDDTNLMIQNLLYVDYRGDLKGIYNGILNSFTKSNLLKYFSYLDEVITEYGIQMGSQKYVYNVSDNQLNFTIGQKYVWCLKSKKNEEIFKVISEGKFGIESEKFNSAINTHLNHFIDFNTLKVYENEINTAIEKVINITVRSSYLKYNDPFIERMVFDKDFRSSVLKVNRNSFNDENMNYSNFTEIITDFKNYIKKQTSQIKDFEIQEIHEKYAWIYDSEKIIGRSNYCHYELITREKHPQKIWIELHFDRSVKKKYKQFFTNIITSDYFWNKEHQGSELSLALKENIDFKDSKILQKLEQGLLKFDNEIGNLIRENYLNEILPKTSEMKFPLNQILFGCPGSGKTYSTKKLAVEIIENRFFGNSKGERDEILKLYDIYSEKKQIRFTTFHQSLSYEDFIEGIKPKTVNNRIQYEIQDGIFTKISSSAQDNWLNSQSDKSNNLPFEIALSKLKEEWEENNQIMFPLKTVGSEFTILTFNEKNLRFKKASGGTAHTLSFKTMNDLYYGSREHSKNGVGIYYPSIIEKLKSYSSTEITSKSLDNFVLIMDEINRGNISSIFGELITLIEDDKRLGEKEKIEVILPYSKEPFGVPPNLYLIGTMNTADRSVEALDTALRRRFSFTEMKSDPQILKTVHATNGIISEDIEIDLVNLLETINARIELLIDKDHQIGHSYFIQVNSLADLKSTFKNKIIPLLEEYFYGDFGKIGLVLGDHFVTVSNNVSNKNILYKFKGYDDTDFLTDKKTFTVKDLDDLISSDFVNIYNNVSELQFNG